MNHSFHENIPVKTNFLVALLPCVVLAACERAETPPTSEGNAPPPSTLPAEPTTSTSTTSTADTAIVTLGGTKDSAVTGELRLTATPAGVLVAGKLMGLTPGTEHGFHVHEHGDCSAPDASSAGNHFNPDNQAHGGPDRTPRHLGDLANLKSNEEGRATVDMNIPGATLRTEGPTNLVGKAFVVHARRDDYRTQPSGDSGGRIACGVVQ